MRPERIVSGGQTGVDRAALDAAARLGLGRGGWCPRGRLAEDGAIPAEYSFLKETAEAEYSQRTQWNVRDSDATLILSWGAPSGGTLLTVETARRLLKPFFVVDLSQETSAALAAARRWLEGHRPKTLNVAGPRASRDARVYGAALAFLTGLLG